MKLKHLHALHQSHFSDFQEPDTNKMLFLGYLQIGMQLANLDQIALQMLLSFLGYTHIFSVIQLMVDFQHSQINITIPYILYSDTQMKTFKIQQYQPPRHSLQEKKQQIYETSGFVLKLSEAHYLNYPIQSLLVVIEQHFSEEPPSANIVCKALKVLSISLKDQELCGGFQKIVLKYSQKKQQLYSLIKIWISFTKSTKLLQILHKISLQANNLLIISTFAYFLFGSNQQKKYWEIGQLLQLYIEQSNKETVDYILVALKNQFMNIQFKFENLITKMNKINFNGEIGQYFCKNLLSWVFKNQSISAQFKQLLHVFLKTIISTERLQNMSVQIDNFFYLYIFLSDCFIEMIQTVLTHQMVYQLWIKLSNTDMDKLGIKTSMLIKSAIRGYINLWKNGLKYWEIFHFFYNRENNKNNKFKLLGLGNQLEGQGFLMEFITKKYLYNYFQGKNFQIQVQNSMLNELIKNNNAHKIPHNAIQCLTEMMRAIENCSSKGGINLLCINKIYAPRIWNKDNIFSQQNQQKLKRIQKSVLTGITDYIKKLKILYQKLLEKAEKKMQKVEIAYNVVIITDKITKKDYCITIQQILGDDNFFTKLLSDQQEQAYKLIYKPPYDDKLPSDTHPPKNPQLEQLHPIVYDAKTVKILKKAKKGLSVQQIQKQLQLNEQKVESTLQRLIKKGLVQQKQQSRFYYLP